MSINLTNRASLPPPARPGVCDAAAASALSVLSGDG